MMDKMQQFHFLFLRENPGPLAEYSAASRASAILDEKNVAAEVAEVVPYWNIEAGSINARAWRYRAIPGRAVTKPEPINPIQNPFWGATGKFSGISFLSPRDVEKTNEAININTEPFNPVPDYGQYGWYMVIVKIL